MRISDWSSDVCSSDLTRRGRDRLGAANYQCFCRQPGCRRGKDRRQNDRQAPFAGRRADHCRGEAVITRQGGAMRQVIRGLGRLEDAAGMLATIVMFLIMGIATTDVVLRYVFNKPFRWSFDFYGLYSMTVLFYLVLSAHFAHPPPSSMHTLKH